MNSTREFSEYWLGTLYYLSTSTRTAVPWYYYSSAVILCVTVDNACAGPRAITTSQPQSSNQQNEFTVMQLTTIRWPIDLTITLWIVKTQLRLKAKWDCYFRKFVWQRIESVMEQGRDVVLMWLDSPLADHGLTTEARYQVSDPSWRRGWNHR